MTDQNTSPPVTSRVTVRGSRCALVQLQLCTPKGKTLSRQKFRSISPECMCKFHIILQIAVISIWKINRFVFDDGQGINSQQCGTYMYFWLQRDTFVTAAICVNLRLSHNILYIQNRILRKYNYICKKNMVRCTGHVDF